MFEVAFVMIARSGVAADSIILLISPATKSSTIRKTDPVKVPIRTQAIMILGPSTEGLGISVVH